MSDIQNAMESVTKLLGRYSTFVRIGTGIAYADYVWIRQRKWKTFDKQNPPLWYQASKKGVDDKPDIYLEPEEYVRFMDAIRRH